MSRRDPYAAAMAFHASAGRRDELWRTIAGLCVIELAWIAIGIMFFGVDAVQTDSIGQTLKFHLAFGLLTLTTFVLVRRLQQRSPVTLFGPIDTACTDFIRVSRAILVFIILLNLIPPWGWAGASRVFGIHGWLALLPVTLIAVLIQTSGEEIIYRGFLQQSLGARFKSPLVWMGGPSIMFGLAHYDPTAPSDVALVLVIWATLFGLAAADLTARTGSLGAAIGLHFANNLPGIAVLAKAGELSGLALFVMPHGVEEEGLALYTLVWDILFLWMFWMVARIAIRR